MRAIRPRVAGVLAVGCLIVAAFQATLALEAPLGAAARGGTNSGQLPDGLRILTALDGSRLATGHPGRPGRGGFAHSRCPEWLSPEAPGFWSACSTPPPC